MTTQKIFLKLALLPTICWQITAGISIAYGDYCTTPPTSVRVNIQSSVSWDAQTKFYTYYYKVTNLESSLIPLKRFLVLIPEPSINVRSPIKWHSVYGSDPSRLNWSTSALDPNDKRFDQIGYSGPKPRLFYTVKPGATLSGFSFQSPNPPAITQYMVAGETTVPTSTPTATDDEPVPNCPGWDFDGPKYEIMTSGITQGPADPNILSVPIRLRGAGEADKKVTPISPEHASGKIGVLIPSSKSFDASTVDVASIQFGPEKVAPISSKLLPSKKEELDDEQEDWETVALGRMFNDRQEDAKERVKRKSLFLVFDLKSLGVRCILDNALFLTGKTKAGKAIAGGAAIKTVGCDPKKPGVRSHKKSVQFE